MRILVFPCLVHETGGALSSAWLGGYAATCAALDRGRRSRQSVSCDRRCSAHRVSHRTAPAALRRTWVAAWQMTVLASATGVVPPRVVSPALTPMLAIGNTPR